jgi:PIN domain nuclease of toxin-antitoxin system
VNRVVLDASALLAVLLQEPGAEMVERHLPSAMISAVNLSEVIASGVVRGLQLESVIVGLTRLSLEAVGFDSEQAYIAALFRQATRSLGLSLGDRACLALGCVRKLPVLTADRHWSKADVGVEVQVIR